LFTDNSRYVIVGSAAYVPTDPTPSFHEVKKKALVILSNHCENEFLA